jgi:uncharacterized membrane protein
VIQRRPPGVPAADDRREDAVAAAALAYVLALVVFAAIDLAWLTAMAPRLYHPMLGDILLGTVKIAPAVLFYLVYPVGLTVFAVLPALREGSVVTALGLGALFGLVGYATYDLTNFATLRNWTLQLTVIDMAWGAALSALASALSYVGTARVMGSS